MKREVGSQTKTIFRIEIGKFEFRFSRIIKKYHSLKEIRAAISKLNRSH